MLLLSLAIRPWAVPLLTEEKGIMCIERESVKIKNRGPPNVTLSTAKATGYSEHKM